MSDQEKLTLFTINMSHYSEKVRWLLDYEKIDYQEEALTPFIHALPMFIKGKRKQTTVVLLQHGSKHRQNSTSIVERISTASGPLKSFPAELRDEAMEIQNGFDAIATPIARYRYFTGFYLL